MHYKPGWKRDKPDVRDKFFSAYEALTAFGIDYNVDLRTTGNLPTVWDQGQTSSCTAHGLGAAVYYGRKKEKKPVFMPSRLFIYWNERSLENDTGEDGGGMIRDGIKGLASKGVPPESYWPFEPNEITVCPSSTAYSMAVPNLIKKYERVKIDDTHITAALTTGVPVVFGIQIYDNFYDTGTNGVVPEPAGQVEGGHCMLIVGRRPDNKYIVRNSWGTSWGDNGYCYIPVNYVTNYNLASDFWAIDIA